MLLKPIESLNPDFVEIQKFINATWNANQSLWQIHQTEATIDVRLEAGDVSLMGEISSNSPNNSRGNYYFNRVRPLLGSVSGHQRNHRKSTIVVPLENGDQKTADQWTKILLGIYKRENVYETISEAFHQGACITGMNLLHVYIDWRADPVSGDVKIENLAYNQFFIDPYFRKLDLSDCNYIWRRSYLTHSAAASLMPDKRDKIMDLPGNPSGMGRDGRFTYMPEASGSSQQNLISYDEFYYRAYRKQRLLIDQQTGETLDISRQAELDVDRFLEENPQVISIEQEVPTVRLAIMIQDEIFYDGPQPTLTDEFPFVAVVGYYSPSMPYFYSRIQGIARSLRDPQMLLNRRIILSADLLESVANSGFIFKEDSVVDVKHLFQTGQGRIIPLKAGAQMTDVQPIPPPQIPPSFFQMQDTFSKELNFVSGISEENMGQIVDDMASGFKAALRQGAGITVLQPLFDRLDLSQNLLGNKIMDIARVNYTPGKVRLLLEGENPEPLFYNQAFGKYHSTTELGFNTITQRQMQFQQLLELRKLGVNIPDSDIIAAATIQNKTEIIERMQQQAQQQQQQQQQQAQMAMQEMQARTQLSQAKAVADQGLGIERLSRVQENQALAQERRAEARKDDESALLTRVKALKEIENIDFAQLEKILALQRMLKAEAHAERELERTQQQAPMQQQQEPIGQQQQQPTMNQRFNAGQNPLQNGSAR